MSTIKFGDPFGLDDQFLKKIDWKLALSRVRHDLRSDFIYSPQLAFIYAKAGSELITELKLLLKSGKFQPGLPITVEVPKTYRIKVVSPSGRLGPSVSRPGSILLPLDRLLYQILADEAAPIIDKNTDKKGHLAIF
jgi:hypothetical protein